MSKRIKLSDFNHDDKNFNKHTDSGMDLLDLSVEKVGIIESITVSSDDKVISGNARKEIISKRFNESEPIVVETDGTRPVILKRTDIKSETKEFFEAAILANTVSKHNINLDLQKIQEVAVEEYQIDVEELGVEISESESLNGIKKEQLTYYKKTHVLLSFPPHLMIEIQDYLQKITEIQGVEYEQSSN